MDFMKCLVDLPISALCALDFLQLFKVFVSPLSKRKNGAEPVSQSA